MSDDPKPVKLPDPVELSRVMTNIAGKSQTIAKEFLERQETSASTGMADPLNVGQAFMELTQRMMADPSRVAAAQMKLWQQYVGLWQNATNRFLGAEETPTVEPAKDDRRFKHEAWQENPVFDYIKQSYLLTARWMQETVRDTDGLDDATAKKVDFYTRQFVDAMSPSNFAMTNPQVIQETMDSGGENLVKGLHNLLDDLERGKGQLHIKMTDHDAFEVGGNIETTPGKVVYENELMQLIQYSPTTETVMRRPLLIVPPWINKFYILDLREKNSFIKWAVSQGITLFVISWVNPDENLAAKTFEDYMIHGPLAALDAMEKATGEREANVIGYCIGGTLLSSTLAYMKSKDDRFKAVTFFTTMVDFEEAGELGVFIDEEQLASLEERMQKDGFLDGSAMATTFNMLRANDLIWSFVINNYLMGKDPFPFDLLYWNSDSTRMPAAMHSFYLRKMYQQNLLVEPGGIELCGVPIDISSNDRPTFILSTKEDHIAPWKATYKAVGLYTGTTKFCLAGSGHIAGVVNPPADKPKYGYYTNTRKPKDPEKWLEVRRGTRALGGRRVKWLTRQGGGKVPARVPGDRELPRSRTHQGRT